MTNPSRRGAALRADGEAWGGGAALRAAGVARVYAPQDFERLLRQVDTGRKPEPTGERFR